MRRAAATEIDPALQILLQDNLGVENRLLAYQALRAGGHEELQVTRVLLEQHHARGQALQECQRIQQEQHAIIERLTAPPGHPAVFVTCLDPGTGRVLVQQGRQRRIVSAARSLDLSALRLGDEVYLSAELNALLGTMPSELRTLETCSFERWLDHGQMLVKSRDEELTTNVVEGLRNAKLRPGDLLAWDRELRIVYGKMERPRESAFCLEDTPRETFAGIGGLDRQVRSIQEDLELHLNHRDVARKYRLTPARSVLLHGPVGTGKTMMARALANWLGTRSPSGRARFMNIKPGSLHSMWYSESERNYREIFRIAREMTAEQPGVPVVLFFDEVDSIGSTRGGSYLRVHDNVLTAFLAELDGLEERGDILVIGATNRLEALDPALLRAGRLGDLVLAIPRPNRQAALEIFARHFPADIPYAQNGHGDDLAATREELIGAAVSRLYAPNGEFGELATLTFRDGKRQLVRASDLVSGAVIANIARTACRRASIREVTNGTPGVCLEDVCVALEQAVETAARALTPQNCRNHLCGLPQDADIVRVEPVVRRGGRSDRYLRHN